MAARLATEQQIKNTITALQYKYKSMPQFIVDKKTETVKQNPKRFALEGRIKQLQQKLTQINKQRFLAQ